MRRWLALIVGMLTGLSLVSVVDGAEERSPPAIRFYRVLAPEDRMKDWPLGKSKYLPVDAEEFERLVSAMKARSSETPPTPSAAIAAAEYDAKLIGERLVGRATLDVSLAAPAATLLPLAPCNLAIEKAFWAHDAVALPKGEGTLGPHPNPLPKGEGTGGSASSAGAALGSGSDGRLGVVVERSGRLNIEWSLAGRRESGDALDFPLEMPAAPANRLFVELPNGSLPVVDRGLIVGSEPVGGASRRWRIELGGFGRVRLRVVSAGASAPRRQLALLRESRTYECSLRGVEVSAQWKLQVYNEPLRQVSVLLDPELQLVSARLGDKAIAWSAAPAAKDEGTRVLLRLPEAIRDTDRIIRLSAVGRPVLDRAWRLPRIRAEGLLWQEGSIAMLMPEPLATDRIVLHNCAQTGTGALSAPRTGQAMQFQSFDADATVEVLLSRCPAKVETVEATAIELDGEEATARVAAQFRVAGETQLAIEADVAPRWNVDAVESVPAGGVDDWSVETGGDGRQRLTVRLRAALSPQRPVQLAITARRLFAPSPERLERSDLPPIGFRGVAASKRLVSVQTSGSYAVNLHGDSRLKRLGPNDLLPSELALFGSKPGSLLFESSARSASLAISLAGREASYAAAIRVDASVGDRALREKFALRCVPQSGQVDRVLVRLFPRRETPPRWTLTGGDGESLWAALAAGTAAPQDNVAGTPAAGTVAPQDERVSARRWSSEEDAAACVDPSAETWELTLRRPRGETFEITGVRETAVSGLPIVASLASLPEAVEQRGTVVIRSLRSGGVRVQNRRLKAVLPEAAPRGEEQTIRGVFRYDPGSDVADGASVALRVGPLDDLAEPSAWIKSCRLESWYQADGAARHVATYDIERSGCKTLRLTMPAEMAAADLHGAWIDGVAAAWQAAGADEARVLSVELPGHRKKLCVAVQWTAAGQSLGIAGAIGAAMPEPDLPVLARHWTAWLPPGYASVDWKSSRLSADETAGDDLQGWTSRCVEIAAGTPPVLRYARVASMHLFAAVAFLLVAGVGCWRVRNGLAGGAVCAAFLGICGAAAVVLPSAYAPIAWGGACGIVFCLALRWAHRGKLMRWQIRIGDRAENLNPGSTVAMTVRVGVVLLGALLTLCCGLAMAVDWPPRTMTWPPNSREKAATSANPPAASESAAAEKAAEPASPPAYRVFVPVDAKRNPVGGKVYVPEGLYQELHRHAAAAAEKAPAWLIVAATYRGELTKEAVSGGLTIDALRAQYDLRVFERETRVRIPLRMEGVNLLRGSVLLDGRPIEAEWEGNGAALAFDVAEPGNYRLELSLRPPKRGPADLNGFDLPIPRVAGSRLELTVPADAAAVEVPSANGRVDLEKEPRRVLAELGPTDRLSVRWQEGAAAGGRRLAVDADQLTWLKVQPGSVLIAARFKLHVAEGQLRQVHLAVDPRLRLLPLTGEDPPTVQVGSEPGQTRLITIRWPRPISGQVTLDVNFLFNGASAVGNIRLPQIELLDVQSTRRWMAVSVDPALDSEEQQGERLEAVAAAEFLKAWGAADSKPRSAYRLPVAETGWMLSTRPHETSLTADQTLALSFDADRVDVLFDARLSVASGYVFQHRLTVPKGLKIERVSAVQEDVDRVQRWSQDDKGITVFLSGPVSGAERILIRGQLPIRLGEKFELPTMRVDKSRIHSATIEVYRRSAVLVSVEGGTVAPDAVTKKSELGRLVKTIAWDGLRRPTASVVVRANRANGSSQPTASRRNSETSPDAVSKSAEQTAAAPSASAVRSADVTLSRCADGTWCGAAALDLDPGGADELDLRLPGGGELVQASVADMPLATKRVGDGVWRVRLASRDARQRVDVIFRGVVPETDRAGRLRFESPTLGERPARQTFWTMYAPPSYTAGEPDGADAIGEGGLPSPRPKCAAGIGGTQTPRFYLCGEGNAEFAVHCNEMQSHRWPAAAVLLLVGVAVAGALAVRKNRKGPIVSSHLPGG